MKQRIITKTWLRHQILAKEFSLFIFVGCFSTVLNYGVFFLYVSFFKNQYLLASSLGYITGVFVSYFGNKILTFQTDIGFKKDEFLIFISIYTCSLIISLVALRMIVGVGVSVFLANLIAIMVSTVTNFTGVKLFLFKNKA